MATEDQDISETMVDYCFSELQYKAKVFEETGIVRVYYGDVVKSDVAIPVSLKEDLKRAVSPLEDVPPMEKDWHPWSNDRVLDLVHPSLFPLMYGRSRILPNALVSIEDCIEKCGDGEVIPIPPEEDTFLGHNGRSTKNPFSKRFQWLPCEVDISGDNDTVK